MKHIITPSALTTYAFCSRMCRGKAKCIDPSERILGVAPRLLDHVSASLVTRGSSRARDLLSARLTVNNTSLQAAVLHTVCL